MSIRMVLLRILIGIGAAVVALVAFVVLSTVADYLFDGDRLAALTNVSIPGDPPVGAWLAKPPGDGPFPAVIMIHEFWGLKSDLVGKAEGLAEEGYLVVAPDTFRGSTTSWIPRAIHQVIAHRSDQVNHDLDMVLDWLATRPDVRADRIAVMGFCYGGRASLNFSLHRPTLAATAVFYGSPVTDVEALRQLSGPVLGIFGGADASIPTEEVTGFERALAEAGVLNRIVVFPGQPHAFVGSMEEIRAGGAPGEAWAELLTFLEQVLKGSPSSRKAGTPVGRLGSAGAGYYLALAWEHGFGSAIHRHR